MRVDALTPREPSAIRDALARREGRDPGRANVCVAGAGAGAGASPVAEDTAEEIGRLPRNTLKQPAAWDTHRGSVSLGSPAVAGILNVTPDSFSDGGLYVKVDDAIRHAEQMIEAGADMIDIGAESTRPGVADRLDPADEWRRLEPVLLQFARRFPSMPVSVDTVNSETGRRALDGGAWALNDVSGLRFDAEIATVCAEFGAGLIVMHSRGSFPEMATYQHAEYDDVVLNVVEELERSVRIAESRGLSRERIVIDPGLGFAKRPEHNYAVLRGLTAIAALGFPVMVGPSRKRFLGNFAGADVADRDNATAAACVVAYAHGAKLFRVHDVSRVRGALQVAHAVREPGCPSSNFDS